MNRGGGCCSCAGCGGRRYVSRVLRSTAHHHRRKATREPLRGHLAHLVRHTGGCRWPSPAGSSAASMNEVWDSGSLARALSRRRSAGRARFFLPCPATPTRALRRPDVATRDRGIVSQSPVADRGRKLSHLGGCEKRRRIADGGGAAPYPANRLKPQADADVQYTEIKKSCKRVNPPALELLAETTT